MKALLALISMIGLSQVLAQGTNMEFEKFDVSPGSYTFLHADIDQVPGQDKYVISATQSFPFYEVDGKKP